MPKVGIKRINILPQGQLPIQAIEYNKAYIEGLTPKRFIKPFMVRNMNEFEAIFGKQENPNYFSHDTMRGLFQNSSDIGVTAEVYFRSLVGNTGSAIDGVVSDLDIDNGNTETCLNIQSAYQENLNYSASGDRVGVKLLYANLFDTTANELIAPGDSDVILKSVIGLQAGMILKFTATGGGGGTVYKKITNVDFSTKTVTWTGVFDATLFLNVGDIVVAEGFYFEIYEKDINGIVTLKQTTDIVTQEIDVTKYSVENLNPANVYIYIEKQTTTATPDLALPLESTDIEWLTGGADGTTPTTIAHWSYNRTEQTTGLIFNFIANPETDDIDIQNDLELFASSREDRPVVFYRVSSNQTKTQLIALGQENQRPVEHYGAIIESYLKVVDVFTVGLDRIIPPIGHVIGAWIYGIALNGIHKILTKNISLRGIKGIYSQVVDDTKTIQISDNDRGDLLEAGINVIALDNTVWSIMNSRTLSTGTANNSAYIKWRYINTINMTNFIYLSVKPSLKSRENEPATIDRVYSIRDDIFIFLKNLWNTGSNGETPLGETFNVSAEFPNYEQNIKIQCDESNNPSSDLNTGKIQSKVWINVPPPAELIEFGINTLIPIEITS